MPRAVFVSRAFFVFCVVVTAIGLSAQTTYTVVDFQNPADIYPTPIYLYSDYTGYPGNRDIVFSKGVSITGGHTYIDYRSGAPVGYFMSRGDNYDSQTVQLSFPANATDISMDVAGWAVQSSFEDHWKPIPLEIDDNGLFVANVGGNWPDVAYQSVYIGQKHGQITVHAPARGGGVYLILIDNIRFRIDQPEQPQTELWASFYHFPVREGAALAAGRNVKAVSGSMRMIVPLGAVFQLGLQQHRTAEPVATIPSIVSRGTAAVTPQQRLLSTQTVDPTVIRAFPDDALASLGNDSFIAVHLGKQDVKVVAPFANVPTITVSVEVVKPTALGTRFNLRDDYFSMVAHNSGIPPQMVKGQAHQEGSFSSRVPYYIDDNWRYEPAGTDYNEVSLGARKAYTNPKYVPFRLDDARGGEIIEGRRDDIDPRRIFFIMRPNDSGQLVDIRLNDDTIRDVTAKEIYVDNDTRTGNGHIRQNWSLFARPSVRDAFNDPADTTTAFIAQTGLAATYGYQQVGWDEAINNRFWAGVTIPAENKLNYKAPRYLFDRDEYINVGGGSTQLGTNIIADKMLIYSTATFTDFTDIEGDLLGAYWQYNRGLVDDCAGNARATYDECVLDKTFLYPPLSSQPVFP